MLLALKITFVACFPLIIVIGGLRVFRLQRAILNFEFIEFWKQALPIVVLLVIMLALEAAIDVLSGG